MQTQPTPDTDNQTPKRFAWVVKAIRYTSDYRNHGPNVHYVYHVTGVIRDGVGTETPFSWSIPAARLDNPTYDLSMVEHDERTPTAENHTATLTQPLIVGDASISAMFDRLNVLATPAPIATSYACPHCEDGYKAVLNGLCPAGTSCAFAAQDQPATTDERFKRVVE